MIDFTELSEPDIIRLLGERFREYRLNLRLTQNELADKAGISAKTISNFESGRLRNMSKRNFLTLMKVIGQIGNIENLLPELPESPYLLTRYAIKQNRVRHGKNSTER